MKNDNFYTITVTDKTGKYINSTKFYILPENSPGICKKIVNWSFNHLRENFISNLGRGAIDGKVRAGLLSKEKAELARKYE